MATSLGWRDVGTVLLSKADAERRKGDEQRGEDGRDAPVFQGAVMSRRQHRTKRQDDREEAPAFLTDLQTVLGNKPEKRVKWLQTALLYAGRKVIKVSEVYDIVAHSQFTADISPGVGAQMKALCNANLHLFSSKQQKHLQSASGPLAGFPDAVPRRPTEEASSRREDRKRRKEESSSSSREPPPRRTRGGGGGRERDGYGREASEEPREQRPRDPAERRGDRGSAPERRARERCDEEYFGGGRGEPLPPRGGGGREMEEAPRDLGGRAPARQEGGRRPGRAMDPRLFSRGAADEPSEDFR